MRSTVMAGFVAALVLMVGASASASRKIVDLDEMTSGGTGCPGSSEPLQARYSERTGRLVVYFSEMKADIGSKTIERKACSLAIPVTMPAGKQLVIGKAAVFGRVELPEKANAKIQAEAFEAGSKGPIVVVKEIGGEREVARDFYGRENETVLTACGRPTIIRANVSVLTTRTGQSESGFAEVEGVALTAKVQDCSNKD